MSEQQEEALQGTFLEPYSLQTTEESREQELYELMEECQEELLFDLPLDIPNR